MGVIFFFQAEDGIRGLVRSRGLGDVYKRQVDQGAVRDHLHQAVQAHGRVDHPREEERLGQRAVCLLYTSDAADDPLCVDLGGRRIIKTKTNLPS